MSSADSPADSNYRASGGASSPSGGVREMEPAEVQSFLRNHDWGVLSTLDGARPYAVPVSYGFDGQHLFFATGAGRKRVSLDNSPAVCLTIAEVATPDRWSSVVVIGDAHPVTTLRDRLHALDVLRRQRAAATLPSVQDLARVARTTVFCIDPLEISGRTRP